APTFVIIKTLIPNGIDEITEYCNAYSEGERKNWPQSYYCDLKTTDVWLAIFAGLLVIVTWWLVCATRRLWGATIENERPWVGLETTDSRGFDTGDIDNVWAVIRNGGRSPAINMRALFIGHVSPAGVPYPAHPNVDAAPAKLLIPQTPDRYPPFHGR